MSEQPPSFPNYSSGVMSILPLFYTFFIALQCKDEISIIQCIGSFLKMKYNIFWQLARE